MKQLLNQSLVSSKVVEIIYLGKNNIFSKRRIIVRTMDDHYVSAFCFSKRQLRKFKLDSILATAPVKKREEGLYA